MINAAQNSVNPYPNIAPWSYQIASYNGQFYQTTGGFDAAAPDRKVGSLRAVGTIIADFDLVDYLTRQESWEGSSDARKARMYAEYGSDMARLDSLKEQHLADIMEILADVEPAIPGASTPTYVVDSGWGYQFFWWLPEIAVGSHAIGEIRRFNRDFVQRINAAAGYPVADPGVHDTGTRLLRRVDSWNTKYPQAPMRVGVVEEYSNPDSRLTPVAQEGGAGAPETMGETSDTASSEERPNAASGAASGAPTANPAGLRGHPSPLLWLTANDRSLRGLVNRARTEQNSETDFALACALCRKNLPPSAIVDCLLDVRTHPNPHDGTDYYARTTAAAWAAVRPNDTITDANINYGLQHPDVLAQLTWNAKEINSIGLIIQYDPRIQEMFWVDVRSLQINVKNQARVKAFTDYMGLRKSGWFRTCASESNLIDVCSWIERIYDVPCLSLSLHAFKFFLARLEFRNPVEEYLLACEKKLPENPPMDLLETWLILAFDLADTPLTRAISRKWIIGAAARGCNPSVFTKSCLTLLGAQSAGKTSMFQILGGEFYLSPKPQDLNSKDSVMYVSSSWIIEFEELAILRNSTLESVKRFITATTDKIRLPFGRIVETLHRPCAYVATSNRRDILQDATGSDRWWIVEIPADRVCNFGFITEIRDSLWGLATREWLRVRDTPEKIEAIHLTREELMTLREANTEYQNEDSKTESVLAAMWAIMSTRVLNECLPLRASWKEIEATLVKEDKKGGLGGLDLREQHRIREILISKGFETRQIKRDNVNTRYWIAPAAWEQTFTEGIETGSGVSPVGDSFWIMYHKKMSNR